MAGRLRTFISIPAPAGSTSSIALYIDRLSRLLPRVRWEPAGKIHLTIRFLGETDEGMVPDILRIMRERTAGLAGIPLTIGGVGVFPSERRPRVIWLGCSDGEGRLGALRAGLENDLQGLGFPADDRPFHPHFTIGRVRAEGVPSHLTSIPKNTTFDPHHAIVDEIFLMRSVLTPGGSEYSVIGCAKFA